MPAVATDPAETRDAKLGPGSGSRGTPWRSASAAVVCAAYRGEVSRTRLSSACRVTCCSLAAKPTKPSLRTSTPAVAASRAMDSREAALSCRSSSRAPAARRSVASHRERLSGCSRLARTKAPSSGPRATTDSSAGGGRGGARCAGGGGSGGTWHAGVRQRCPRCYARSCDVGCNRRWRRLQP